MKWIYPIFEFTEDDWKTKYTGTIIERTFYSYLIRSAVYGTFWISKNNVKKVKEGYWSSE